MLTGIPSTFQPKYSGSATKTGLERQPIVYLKRHWSSWVTSANFYFQFQFGNVGNWIELNWISQIESGGHCVAFFFVVVAAV